MEEENGCALWLEDVGRHFRSETNLGKYSKAKHKQTKFYQLSQGIQRGMWSLTPKLWSSKEREKFTKLKDSVECY